MKKIIILVLVVLIVGGGWLIYDQRKYTTYGEVISDMLGESPTVTKIRIENHRENLQLEIASEEKIRSILEEPIDMKLKQNRKIPTVDYMIKIYTTNGNHDIMLGKNRVDIGLMGRYKIVKENKLYDIIETEILK